MQSDQRIFIDLTIDCNVINLISDSEDSYELLFSNSHQTSDQEHASEPISRKRARRSAKQQIQVPLEMEVIQTHNFYGKELLRLLVLPELESNRSTLPAAGRGLFSRKLLHKNTVLGVYTGKIQTTPIRNHRHQLQVADKGAMIVADPTFDILSNINEPIEGTFANCYIYHLEVGDECGDIPLTLPIVITGREVQPGTELTVIYSHDSSYIRMDENNKEYNVGKPVPLVDELQPGNVYNTTRNMLGKFPMQVALSTFAGITGIQHKTDQEAKHLFKRIKNNNLAFYNKIIKQNIIV